MNWYLWHTIVFVLFAYMCVAAVLLYGSGETGEDGALAIGEKEEDWGLRYTILMFFFLIVMWGAAALSGDIVLFFMAVGTTCVVAARLMNR